MQLILWTKCTSQIKMQLKERIKSPNLPLLVVSSIIQYCLLMDMTMLGTLSRVSNSFRELTLPFLPRIHICDTLVVCLNTETDEDCSINVSRLYEAAGRNSGLASSINQNAGRLLMVPYNRHILEEIKFSFFLHPIHLLNSWSEWSQAQRLTNGALDWIFVG